ncbi:MAG: hypothetical protein ACI97A_004468, partial [Planctomycetota bacterium]
CPTAVGGRGSLKQDLNRGQGKKRKRFGNKSIVGAISGASLLAESTQLTSIDKSRLSPVITAK